MRLLIMPVVLPELGRAAPTAGPAPAVIPGCLADQYHGWLNTASFAAADFDGELLRGIRSWATLATGIPPRIDTAVP